jgi:hypothetical protein
MRKTSVLPELAQLSNMEKPKEYRDRKTHERRTKETVKTHEREHPVHKPYTRDNTNWTRRVSDIDEDIDITEF